MDKVRKLISKKLRFEIFKRDNFKCQYCGSFTPNVLLEIDHIIPVVKGGNNSIENLLTACFDCNRGKSKNELNQVVNSLIDTTKVAKEKLKQYKEFKAVNDEISRLLHIEVLNVECLYRNCFRDYEFTEAFKNTVKNFINKIGYYETMDSMTKACAKSLNQHYTLKYFCGICHNKIKQNVKPN